MKDNTSVMPLRQPGFVEDPLTGVAREGARRMLATALEAEVAAFLGQFAEEARPVPAACAAAVPGADDGTSAPVHGFEPNRRYAHDQRESRRRSTGCRKQRRKHLPKVRGHWETEW